MQIDALTTLLINQLTPELLVASLLVLASLCFFSGALVLLLVLRPRLPQVAPSTERAAQVAAPATDIASAPAPATGRRRSRLGRRRSTSPPALQENGEGRDFSREILLAQQGSDAQQLMKSCGLTQLEANLVVKLYGHAGTETRPAALG